MPASVLSVEQDLRDKTYKAGIISRALAIFRVDEVNIYLDEDSTASDQELLVKLLRYQTIPSHLKKKAVPVDSDLKYSGILPPLNLPNHLPPRKLKQGDVLDVLVESKAKDECKVYLGEEGYGRLRPCTYNSGDIVTARVAGVSGGSIELEPTSWGNVYTGYSVTKGGPLLEELLKAKSHGYAVVGTSKYGVVEYSQLRALSGRPTTLVLGGPKSGLIQFTGHRLYDVLINAAPHQGTETLRTEEALLASLAILNAFLQD